MAEKTEIPFHTNEDMADAALEVAQISTQLRATRQPGGDPILGAAARYGHACEVLMEAARAANPHLVARPGTVDFYTGQKKTTAVLKQKLNGYIAGIARKADLEVPPDNAYFADCSPARTRQS